MNRLSSTRLLLLPVALTMSFASTMSVPALSAQGVDCLEAHKQAMGILQSAQSKVLAQQGKTDGKTEKEKSKSTAHLQDKSGEAADKTGKKTVSVAGKSSSITAPAQENDALKKEDFSARFGKAVKTLKEGQCKAQLQQLTDYVQTEQKKYPVAVPIED